MFVRTGWRRRRGDVAAREVAAGLHHLGCDPGDRRRALADGLERRATEVGLTSADLWSSRGDCGLWRLGLCKSSNQQSVSSDTHYRNSHGFVLSILPSFPPLPPLLLPVQAPVQPTTRSRAGRPAPPPADAPTSPPPSPSLRAAASFKASEEDTKGGSCCAYSLPPAPAAG